MPNYISNVKAFPKLYYTIVYNVYFTVYSFGIYNSFVLSSKESLIKRRGTQIYTHTIPNILSQYIPYIISGLYSRMCRAYYTFEVQNSVSQFHYDLYLHIKAKSLMRAAHCIFSFAFIYNTHTTSIQITYLYMK